MMLRKVLSKYQVTLPKSVVRELRIERGDLLQCEVKDRRIVFSPVQVAPRESGSALLGQISRKWEGLGITEKDVEAAVRWVRRR